MTCPYLKEVVMLYCDAYPVKKMIPLDRLVSAEPCLAQGWRGCPLFHQADAPPVNGNPEAAEARTEKR